MSADRPNASTSTSPSSPGSNAQQGHEYSNSFFDYIETGARRSARAMIDAVRASVTPMPASILDVGCGRGAWLAEWRTAVPDVMGVDGDYVDTKTLLVDRAQFAAADLSKPLDLGRKFDVAQSLEVAEHLPPASSSDFADSLARHADLLVFSAAVPGQGGEKHINERPLSFWRDQFQARGFQTFDCLRPRLDAAPGVEPWYRYNTLLYARGPALERLTPEARATKIQAGARIPSRASFRWKLRKLILRPLPEPIVTAIAMRTQRMRKTPGARTGQA